VAAMIEQRFIDSRFHIEAQGITRSKAGDDP
jgi:hypothetical protein